jgi:ubiquinone/menaquinone biosynthesis C-methylase UbiE/uncharacterized protein YbaR (Trm112 family)
MNPRLLPLLCCPTTRSPLQLEEARLTPDGDITDGWLIAQANPLYRYQVVRGVPRFAPQSGAANSASVESFGDQWNYFNYDDFASHFRHALENTFGDISIFRGKVVVDAGAGAGMQSRWLAEAGAAHVIALELSHAVDGIIAANLRGVKNVDVIQCSIDSIPLRNASVLGGIVMCHNVIQHTPSVQDTLTDLWRIAGAGTEVTFNCYTRDDSTPLKRARFWIYQHVRQVVAGLPFAGRLAYAHLMAALRFVPVLGWVLEKADLMRRGMVFAPTFWSRVKASYSVAVLNTFDYFGAHAYQHHHSFDEIKVMVAALAPPAETINGGVYYQPHQPVGIMLRLLKHKVD